MRALCCCLLLLSLTPALADSIPADAVLDHDDALGIEPLRDQRAGAIVTPPEPAASVAPVVSSALLSPLPAQPFELGYWLETPEGAAFYEPSALDRGGFGHAVPLRSLQRLRLPGGLALVLPLRDLRSLPPPASASLLDTNADRRRLEQLERALRPPEPPAAPDED